MDNNDCAEATSTFGMPKNNLEQRAKIFAALSDPTRLRIVELLAERGEISGSEVANQIGISLALFCHHSRTLVEAGLLQTRKDGQTKYNSLNRELLVDCLASLRGLADNKQQQDLRNRPPDPPNMGGASPTPQIWGKQDLSPPKLGGLGGAKP